MTTEKSKTKIQVYQILSLILVYIINFENTILDNFFLFTIHKCNNVWKYLFKVGVTTASKKLATTAESIELLILWREQKNDNKQKQSQFLLKILFQS